MRKLIKATLVMMQLLAFSVAIAAEPASRSLDNNVETIKRDAIELSKQLRQLEQKVIYPADTQLSVFVSMDTGEFFQLKSVALRIDDKLVASHIYNPQEAEAIQKGAIQRLYLGNVAKGEHHLVATFTGVGPRNREYQRSTELKITKGGAASFVELAINDVKKKHQPEFHVRTW